MEMTEKAMLDSVIGANLAHEDLSNSITLTDGPNRPISQAVGQVPAKNKLHQWNEQGLNSSGRTNAAGGGATYAEGITPAAAAKAAGRKSNVTCRIGRLAQVSDTMRAEFDGGGTVTLADGEMERQMMDALDLEAALALIEVLNQAEWMHVTGDSANATMEGGETDGLIKWTTSSGGNQVNTGGSGGSPTAFAESFISDGMRTAALGFPSIVSDTLLISGELGPDMTKLVQNGASRPLVQVASGQNIELVAGASVGYYTTPYGVLKIVPHPYLSPTFNPDVTNSTLLAVNLAAMVKIASLNKLNAELLPRTGPSISKMITWEWAQEHRNVKHTWIAQNIESAVT
jgi:hypothetical protein